MGIKTIFKKLIKDNIGVLASIVAWSVMTSLVPILVGLILPFDSHARISKLPRAVGLVPSVAEPAHMAASTSSVYPVARGHCGSRAAWSSSRCAC